MHANRLLSFLTILLFYIFSNCSYADLDVQVFPGFNGYQKNNHWLPLYVVLSNENDDIECVVSVSIQGRKVYSVPVTLYSKSRKTLSLYVPPQKFHRNIIVEIDNINGKSILQKDVSINRISEHDRFILVVEQNIPVFPINTNIKTSNQDLEQYISDTKADSENIYVSYVTVDLLPACWKGYDSVDIVVLGDILADEFSRVQKMALIDWVYSGGILVVSGGANSHNLKGTFIEKLLPVKLGNNQVLKSLKSLSKQFGYDINLFSSVIITSSELIKGGEAIITSDSDKIIIAERIIGSGKCVFLAYDYLDPAFSSWKGNRYLLNKILPKPATRKYDISNELVKLFSINKLPISTAHSSIGVFLLLYIICFSLVSIFLKKKNLPFLAIPIIILLFTLGSLGFSYAKERRKVILNDFSIMRILANYNRLSINSYFTLFSPKTSKFVIKLSKEQYFFVDQVSPSQDMQNYELSSKEDDVFSVEISTPRSMEQAIFYGETCSDFDNKIPIYIEGRKLKNNLPYNINDCYFFDNGYYDHIEDLKSGAEVSFRTDRVYSDDVIDNLSLGDESKRRFMNIFHKNININSKDRMLIGWIDNSALSNFSKIDIEGNYKSYGRTLAIIYF